VLFNLIEQLLNALVLAGLLFLVSAGLSLVFGILRVVNFAHGVFYMLGAYLGYTTVAVSGWFWPALLVVPPIVGLVGALLEASTLRFIYRRPPIYQLLLTFGFALILEESVRVLYGNTAKGVEPPQLLQGAVALGSIVYPRYRLFLVVLGLAVGGVVWLLLQKTRAGLVIRAVAQNSEMADCLGVDVARVRTLVFGAACALAGLGGVAAAPMTTAYLGMGIGVIVDAFVVVVIGGLGSIGGSMVGSLIVGAAQTWGAFYLPETAMVIMYAVMGAILVLPALGPLRRGGMSRARAAALIAVLVLAVLPWVLARHQLSLLTDLLIYGLFALSLDLIMGYTGLVSFGHAAYFGLGAYGSALVLIHFGQPVPVALLAGALLAGVVALPVGWFSTRATGIYFAMLTLAFAQLLYTVAYKWRDLTGGSDGIAGVPKTALVWGGPSLASPRAFYFLVAACVLLSLAACYALVRSPFGRAIQAIRENERRFTSLGRDPRPFKLVVFVIAAVFAGLAGALFAPFRGFASPEVMFWVFSGRD
jgi:branched-chain amino acid transport system permease protein